MQYAMKTNEKLSRLNDTTYLSLTRCMNVGHDVCLVLRYIYA